MNQGGKFGKEGYLSFDSLVEVETDVMIWTERDIYGTVYNCHYEGKDPTAE